MFKKTLLITLISAIAVLGLGPGCAAKKNVGAAVSKNRLIVIASGEAIGKAGAEAESVEKTALNAAKRNALEQAGGYVKSQTRVSMFDLTEDMVKSWSEGFVRVIEVIGKKMERDAVTGAYRSALTIKAEVLLADMEEFQNRSDQEEKGNSRKELTFEVNMIAERQLLDGNWEDMLIQDGSLLNTGDRFQIIFKPHNTCYLYIINVDSKKKIYTLFPNARTKIGNHLQEGEEYALPDRNKFYELDDAIGIETIYFIASYTPMNDIEWLLSKALGKDGEATLALLDSTVKKRGRRGAGRIVTGKSRVFTLSDGKEIMKAADLLQGNGSVVKVVRFHHN